MVRKTLSVKVAALAGTVLFAAAGAAAAAGELPDAAQDGLSNASSHVGIELPASKDSHPTKDDHPSGGAQHETGAPEAEGNGPEDNHGAEVSAVARTDATGRDKGAAVSEVARNGHGQGGQNPDHPAVDTPNEGGTDTADEASNGASEDGTSNAAPQAAEGSGNAEGHGRP